jgi:uncharacterized alkaline shock family protein YloU
MSTTTVLPTQQPEAGERGRTTVSEQVVERIGSVLAAEFDGIGGAARRVLSVAVGGEQLDRDAQVSARVDGGTVTLAVRCSVRYPAPVAATTEALRGELCTRIAELTGLRVRRVDITVVALHATGGGRVK